MDRQLLTLSVPNVLTIWAMMFGLLIVYAVGAQVAMRAGWIGGKSSATANNSGGY